MTDDRAAFERDKRQAAARMAADEALAADALDLNAAADRHDWSYQWSWLGLPVIQMPPDIVAMQEVIWETRPQLVIETGIARGGSLVLYASILELIGEGEVLGIDIDIRPHNLQAIEAHPLAKRIRMVEGSSLDDDVVAQAGAAASEVERVMVVLDSNHTHDHVLGELRAVLDRSSPSASTSSLRTPSSSRSRCRSTARGSGGRETTRPRRCERGSKRSRASSPTRS